MAIRIRQLPDRTVALCAAETDPAPGDLYLDDAAHYALAAKFALDWQGRTINWAYPEEWGLMETQKLRDAEAELNGWLAEQAIKEGRCPGCGLIPTMVWTGGAVPEPSHVVCGCDD